MAKSQLTTEDVRDAATNLWALGMVEHFDAWLDRHDQAARADELRKALTELRAAKQYLAAQGLDLTADAIFEGIENRLADLEGDDHA